MMSLLREPLVHFLLLGGAIFGLYALVEDTPPPIATNTLVITEDHARRLVSEYEATWRRPPSVAELELMIEDRVREEVYVREALALGFDRDDAVIRRRLQMKMEFLTESGAGAPAPDDAALEAHLAAHPERFATPPLVAFEQVLLEEDVGREEASLVAARLNDGGIPGGDARPTLLPGVFRPAPAPVVDGAFGPGFFDAIAALPPGEWSGPIETPLGHHLVRVTERRAVRLPRLAEIRDLVEQDWRASVAQALREERYEALLSRYAVVRPDLAQVLAP